MCFQAMASWLLQDQNEINWFHNSHCKVLLPFMLVSAYYNNSVNKHSMLRHTTRLDSFQMTKSKVGVCSSLPYGN